jgi:hypothetical protein
MIESLNSDNMLWDDGSKRLTMLASESEENTPQMPTDWGRVLGGLLRRLI